MKVKELIDALKKLNPEAKVNCMSRSYDNDTIYIWDYVSELHIENEYWDEDNNCPIYDVYIK